MDDTKTRRSQYNRLRPTLDKRCEGFTIVIWAYEVPLLRSNGKQSSQVTLTGNPRR